MDKDKLIQTTLSKRTLKKLIIDTCTKTAFSFDEIIYEQIDVVSMGASLGPVLANIIMTEFEKVFVENLLSTHIIRFYCRYVDDTLILVKPNDIQKVLNKFNSFHKNIQFTVDIFENTTPHFLDLEIHPDGISIYRKETHTGQYTNFESYTTWNYKTSWLRSLVSRAKKICTPNKLKSEINNIKTFAAYNGFPKRVANAIITKTAANQNKSNDVPTAQEETIDIFLTIPYLGNKGESILKSTKRKLFRCFKNDKHIKLIVKYKTTKVCFFTPTKDRTPLLSNSFVVYKINCPGCAESYIGKTECTLYKRTSEHAWKSKDSAVNSHLNSCHNYDHIKDLFAIERRLNVKEFHTNSVRDNINILAKTDNWNTLLFLESLYIKDQDPQLNTGLKATKQLKLF